MINNPTEIAKYFNCPERTFRNWVKEDDWRFELLEKLDTYKVLEEEALKKAKKIFNEDELRQLIRILVGEDIEIIPTNLKEKLKNEILYDELLEDIERKALLMKIEELCDFEIHSLIEAIYRSNRGEEFDIERVLNYVNSL